MCQKRLNYCFRKAFIGNSIDYRVWGDRKVNKTQNMKSSHRAKQVEIGFVR